MAGESSILLTDVYLVVMLLVKSIPKKSVLASPSVRVTRNFLVWHKRTKGSPKGQLEKILFVVSRKDNLDYYLPSSLRL